MKNKKKIVFFNGFFIPHFGGVERYTWNLVNELKKEYDITIVTSNFPKCKVHEKNNGINIYRLSVYNLFKNRYPIYKKNKVYKMVIKELNDMKIDHIICNTRYYPITMLGVKYSKKRNIDLSIIDHSSNFISIGNKILDFFLRKYEFYLTNKIKKYNPRFYGVSKRTNEWLKYYNIKSSGVFYNSIISNESFEKVNKKRIKITYAGRVIKEKGLEILAKAYLKLKDKYDIELNIAGDGDYLNYLKNKYPDINYLGLLDHNEVMNLLKETSIFVYPSCYPEGLPTSILEAGIMKCAVVATDKGGIKEVIESDKYGFIINEDVNDLVNKIEVLLCDRKLMIEMQNNIYKMVKTNFVWEKTAKKVIKELKKYE